MKRFKRFLLSLFAVVMLSKSTFAQGTIGDFLSAGIADANKLSEAYLRPYGEIFGANLNAGWYNSASVHKLGGFDLTFLVSSTFAPTSKKSFDINSLGLELFEVSPSSGSISPTVAGNSSNLPSIQPKTPGGSFSRFSLPNGSGYDVFPTPMLQGAFGVSYHTEVMFRYLPRVKYHGDGELGFWGIGIKHSIKEYMPFIKRLAIVDVSVLGAYTKLNGSALVKYKTIDGKLILGSNAFTFRLLGGVNLANFSFYSGIGYGNAITKFDLKGSFANIPLGNTFGTVQNPISIEYNNGNLDFNVGGRLRLGLISIHADYTVGKYNMLTAGVGLNYK